MEGICSFSEKAGITCGECRGVKKIDNLLECLGDVKNHLGSCHLSKSNLNEYQLILVRAGIFNLNAEQISYMTVCPKHRNYLGKFWRPLKTCQYPMHTGSTRECKDRHVINPQMSEDIMKLYNKFVQAGSRKFF